MFDIVELSVPLVAEVTGGTPWHREHMAERYGLFTIIVLGESLLGSANAIIEALVDYVTGSSELSYVAVSLTATVPVAVFILAIWAVAYPGTPRIVRTVIPIGAVVTVASTWVPVPIAGVAVVIVAMVVVLVCNPVDGDDDTEHEHKADAKEVNEVRN